MPVIVRRLLKVVAWTAVNLLSYAVPLWLTVVWVRQERAALIASGDPLWASHDTPPSLAFFGLALMWTVVLLVLNLALIAIWHWRRKRLSTVHVEGTA